MLSPQLHAVDYYVNDNSTNGDVYCTAIGNSTNSGLGPASPKIRISEILDDYTLSGGDTIWVDTGFYTNGTSFNGDDQGSPGNYLRVIGSTNVAATGTVLSVDEGSGISISKGYIECGYLTFRECTIGFRVNSTYSPRVHHAAFINNSYGIWAGGGGNHNAVVSFSRFAGNTYALFMFGDVYGYTVSNAVCWANDYVIQGSTAGNLNNWIYNSVIVSGAVMSANSSIVQGDYNIIGFNTVLRENSFPSMVDWQLRADDNWHSTIADPRFADPGALDFHPRSVEGTWSNGTWVTYTSQSPCIDFGNPASPAWTNEPVPNGQRVNIGVYAGSAEASKSRTNAWLFPLSYNDGGTLNQSGTLYWTYGAFTNGALVNVAYSYNGGSAWTNIVRDYPVTNGQYTWTATGFPGSVNARWRVASASDAAVSMTNNEAFVVRPTMEGFDFYVNDASTNGDVYCSQPGNPANDGLSFATPMDSLQRILDAYDLGAGDTVFVDTGLYTNTVTVNYRDSGVGVAPVNITGSTNSLAGGSVFEPVNSLSHIFTMQGVRNMILQHVVLRDGNYALYLGSSGSYYSQSNIFNHVWTISNAVGVALGRGSYNVFNSCVSFKDDNGIRTVVGTESQNRHNRWGNGICYECTSATDLDWTNTISFSNSVIVGGTAFNDEIARGDYNVIWNADIKPGTYETLVEMQQNEHTWQHSTWSDPLFENAAGLDFHPESSAGRYDPVSQTYVTNDGNISILVDFGNPLSMQYTNEPSPNGARLNAGIYGGTAQASKSDTNAWLQVLSLNDGGLLDAQSAQDLYWNYGNVQTNQLLSLQLSRDSGASWITMATNILVTNGVFTWADTNQPSSVYARWRVVLNADTNVNDCNKADFSFRNGPFVYYVNDDNTAGDVYTTAPGDSGNLGVSPGTPKASISEILSAYDLEPGDIIYMDTGEYVHGVNVGITKLDMGTNNNPVIIQGSTNYVAGGSVLSRNVVVPSTYVLKLDAAQGQPSDLTIRDIIFKRAGRGLYVDSACRINLERVTAKDCLQDGLYINNSSNIVVQSCIAKENGIGAEFVNAAVNNQIRHSVFWHNTNAALKVLSGWCTMTNSAVVVDGPNASGYYTASPTNILGDYNLLYCENEGIAGYIESLGRNLDTLAAWVDASSQEMHSICSPPLFADPENDDFHLKTATPLGRRTLSGDLTSDLVTSPLIDSGNPSSVYTNEPLPNGRRVNIGLYGNTWQASIGNTNAWVHAASFKSGGRVSGDAEFCWVAGNAATGHSFKIELSCNGGIAWSILTNGIAGDNGLFTWDTTQTNDTPAALWRITSLADGAVTDQTTNFFAIRNTNLNIYVNDYSVTGDVFTTAIGAAANWESTVDKPMDSLHTVFDRFDLEPGDTVWVDTGWYTSMAPVEITRYDSGMADRHVSVIGNTNARYSASVLENLSTHWGSKVLVMENTTCISLSNLVLQGAVSGAVMTNASDIVLSLRCSHNDTNGLIVGACSDIDIIRSVIDENGARGIGAYGVNNLRIAHSIISSNHGFEVSLSGSDVEVRNSILDSGGAGNYVYSMSSSVSLDSDYNNIRHSSVANVGIIAGRNAKYLSNWQNLTSNDLHSLSHDPQFASWSSNDFHLKSQSGRYDNGSTVTDAVTSLLIDTGDPSSVFTNEPLPNGQRVNIGLYGNHREASRSRTNSWMIALTLNDGGTIQGTNYIYWTAGGAVTGALAMLDFSWDGGTSWTNIATNVTVADGRYLWCTTNYLSTPIGVWRIVSQDDTNTFGMTENYFALKNEPLGFYVNDSSTNGDVYTTAAGDPLNDGLRPSTPKDSITELINSYVFDPGDEILVDTGMYALTNTITLTELSGDAEMPIRITGSTNFAAGGSLLDAGGEPCAVDIRYAHDLQISHLNITNSGKGVQLISTTNCVVEYVNVFNGGDAFVMQGGASSTFSRCSALSFITNGIRTSVADSKDIRWEQGVMSAADVLNTNNEYITTGTCVYVEEGGISISNSVFCVGGIHDIVYKLGIGAEIFSDYNNAVMSNGAMAAFQEVNESIIPAPTYYDSLSMWSRESGYDRHSLSHEPDFAGIAIADFHPLSTGGRYDPITMSVVTDSIVSVLIDAGDPSAIYTNELAPNGARMNMGVFGNSVQASRTSTNSSLTTVSLNDGGYASGTNFMLYWIARGNATGQLLRLAFSPDAGLTWQPIATNIPAADREYVWDTTMFTTTVRGVWKISSENEPAVSNQTRSLFAVRNVPVHFYVNDTNTEGDVYTTSAGNSGNSGLAPDQPKRSLQEILDAYDLEGGDVVYVDTGNYSNQEVCTVGQLDTGRGTNRVVFQGSTNLLQGGTVFRGQGMRIYESKGLEVRYFRFPECYDYAIRISDSTNTMLNWIFAQGGNNSYLVQGSHETCFGHCVGMGARSNGLRHINSRYTEWQNGVLWSNGTAVYAEKGGSPQAEILTVSNSILGVWGDGKYIYSIQDVDLYADYNCYVVSNDALLATESAVPIWDKYMELSRWVRDTGRDTHSIRQDPACADPGAGDFHLKSQAGRYNSITGLVVTDNVTSVLIDGGNPQAVYTNEVPPNGHRKNIGLYGNTRQASRSPTNAALTLLSLTDGGRCEGTWPLYWLAQGDATGHTVRIEYSPDAGSTWIELTNGIPADAGSYDWDTTQVSSSVRALWAVISENDAGVFSYSQVPFAIRNEPISFYVNDSSTNGDVYCTAAGSGGNLGLSPGAPKASIQQILAAYDLESEDTVYVDTGTYGGSASIYINWFDSAGATNVPAVVFQGSTNWADGGSEVLRTSGPYGFDLYQALNIELRNFFVSGGSSAGVNMDQAYGSACSRLQVTSGGKGFALKQSDNVRLEFNAVYAVENTALDINDSQDISWFHGVLWSNASHAVTLSGGSKLSLKNSILGLFEPGIYAYNLGSSTITSDYNCIFLTNGARVATKSAQEGLPYIYFNVGRWAQEQDQDVHTLTADPCFVAPEQGDFHLRSVGGHYDIASGLYVADACSSPLIDAADPASAWTNEPEANGGRANIGMYGNTEQASKTATNAAFSVISFNDGGIAEDLLTLYWVAHGHATGHTVKIEYSSDMGKTWQTIVSGIDAVDGESVWNTTLFQSTVLGKWRISSLDEPAVYSQTEKSFAVRNVPLDFYVNDNALVGDIYTTAVGQQTNWGTSPDVPKASIAKLLETWDIEPGDTIYVDTGTYLTEGAITIDRFDAGLATNDPAHHVNITGSTNDAFGGSVLYMFSGKNGLSIDEATGLNISYFRIQQADTAVELDSSSHCSFSFIRASGGGLGFDLDSSEHIRCSHCAVWENRGEALSCYNRSHLDWFNGVIWSNGYGLIKDEGSKVKINNTVFGCFGDQSYVYFLENKAAGVTSDYNSISLYNDASTAAILNKFGENARTTRYVSVAKWLERTDRDKYTLTFDPGFADVNNGDFHLRSTRGRYEPGTGWTNDAEPSLLIDSGNPASGYTNEPMPNGGRINIDLYGNTGQASMTPTQGWYSIISFNDGGSALGTNVELRWFAGWIATGHLVHIDYSADNGVTWTNIVTNWPASTLSYDWDSVDYGRSALSRWRIVSQVNPSITDTSDYRFVLRNGGQIPYYVNDASTNGDVYCSTVGHPTNNGLLPSSPLDSIQTILDNYELEPFDIIYVDSGTYNLSAPVRIDDLDSGWGTNYVTIQGSTNPVVPTVLDRQTYSSYGMLMQSAEGIRVRDMTVKKADVGVRMYNSLNCLFQNIRVEDNRSAGFALEKSDIGLSHVLVWGTGTTNGWALISQESSVACTNVIFWDNISGIQLFNGGSLKLRNSVLHAAGGVARVFLFDTLTSPSVVDSDYNNIVVRDGALVAEKQQATYGSDYYGYLVDWQDGTGCDTNSISIEPLFVDQTSGDFHLRSVSGQYIPGGWVTNTQHSPLIDIGNPVATYSNEPLPNGARLNLGLYGNTPQASKSRSNQWILVKSLNDGGVIAGTNTLRWDGGNITNGTLVRLEFSDNGKVSWENMASNVIYDLKEWEWDVSHKPLIANAYWRIIMQENTNIADVCDEAFAIKNNTVEFYINDTSTVGDVYTTAIGQPYNSGTNAASPLNNPASLFAVYPVGAGDVVYIDTGTYIITNDYGIEIDALNRGTESLPLVIHGSTNTAAGGSIIDRNDDSGIGIKIRDTRYIQCDYLRLTGAGNGLSIHNALGCTFSNLWCYGNEGAGFVIDAGAILYRCLSWNNNGNGISISADNNPVYCRHSVVWNNRRGGIDVDSGVLMMSNSIVHAYRTNTYVYKMGQGASVRNDFNILYPVGYARLAYDNGKRVIYENLRQWQDEEECDTYSMIFDPLFADPGNGDFHLQSQNGRYASGTFINDAESSWAIDAGGFDDAYHNETTPNGDRLNAGLYGNTCQASRSITNNPEVIAVTFNDGGVMSGEQPLYWRYRGLDNTNRIRIEYSPIEGADWILISSNISLADNVYIWNDTNPPSPVARWRLIVEANTNIHDTIDTNFMKRTGPISFYVNDASTNGDVYTTAPGSPTNTGFATNSPKSDISEIFTAYDLSGGDTIYIDTGVYTQQSAVYVGYLDSGSATSLVRVIGSTNQSAGGSCLDWNGIEDSGFWLDYARGFEFNHLKLQQVEEAFYIDNRSAYIYLNNMTIVESDGAGLYISDDSRDVYGLKIGIGSCGVGIKSAGNDLYLDSCVIWSNAGNAIELLGAGADVYVTNSVLFASGTTNYCYYLTTNTSVSADFNNYYVISGAHYGVVNGIDMDGLPQWTQATTQDVHSLSVDPLFHAAGGYDFHPVSSEGRFDPTSESYVQVDTNFSPLIDMGATNTPYTGEPEPNGARRNIGMYGNTTQASKSDTNSWLMAVTASGGGLVNGLFYLVWGWGGMEATNNVILDYSYDNGVSWTNIGMANVAKGQYLWLSNIKDGSDERWLTSPFARWRVMLEADTNTWDMTDNYFGLRNHPFNYFMNDTSLVNDVYTTAIGSDTNLGFFDWSPKATLKNLLASVDMEGGDSILIDSGTYLFNTNNYAVLGLADQGRSGNPAYIKGNTNELLTWLVSEEPMMDSKYLLRLQAGYVDIESMGFVDGNLRLQGDEIILHDLAFSNALISARGALHDYDGIGMTSGRISTVGDDLALKNIAMEYGAISIKSTNAVIENALLFNGGVNLSVAGDNIEIKNNTIASEGTAFRHRGGGNAVLENNILIAEGPTNFCIKMQKDSTIQSDYNNLYARSGAWIGNFGGNWERLLYWQRASEQDENSISIDPLFVNEAGGDLHLQSVMGHWTSTGFANDVQTSPCMDIGNPVNIYSNETMPNGGRINMGAYGNTEQASHSRIDPWLLAISMNDGGVLRGTNTLRWALGNLSGSPYVRIEYSADGGGTWVTSAVSVAATAREYEWDTTQVASSLDALWRIVLISDTSVWDVCDTAFNVRNSNLVFYVNDASTAGDVYCTAVGNDGNNGLSPSTPKLTIQALLDTYDTEGGDVIKIDTGVYTLSSDIEVIWSRGGDADYGNMIIQGSTNFAAGGSVIRRNSTLTGRDGMEVYASHISLKDLTFDKAYRGVFFSTNRYAALDGVFLRSNQYGFVANGALAVTCVHARVWKNAGGGVHLLNTRTTTVENCTFVANTNYAVNLQYTAQDILQNNIFYLTGSNTVVLSAATNLMEEAFLDYNVYYFTDVKQGIWKEYQDLRTWQLEWAHDFRSSVTNPLFADVAGGDFHLQSTADRYVDGSGWVADAQDSWAIDKGNPASDYNREPMDNGDRINIGAYGNSIYASKGYTDTVVEVRSLNNRTHIDYSNSLWALIWTAQDVPTDTTFRVEYSGDAAQSWTPLATNVSPYQEYVLWQTTPTYNTYEGYWRVISEDGTYSDTNNIPFDIFYGIYEIHRQGLRTNRNYIIWTGAWGEWYQVQYSECETTNDDLIWYNAPTGALENQTPYFEAPHGGDLRYEDVDSTNVAYRLYRVIMEQF